MSDSTDRIVNTRISTNGLDGLDASSEQMRFEIVVVVVVVVQMHVVKMYVLGTHIHAHS